MFNNLDQFQTIIGYSFKDIELLQTALTHRSSLNEQGVKESNERLEFLGDAILEHIITSFLYHQRKDDPEGILTAARSSIVRTETLSQISKNLQVGLYLRMSKGESQSGGRENPSILENAFEALVGAIYEDGGIDAAQTFITKHLIPVAVKILEKNQFKDPKSTLQEKVQSLGFASPTYTVVTEIGPDHDKTFEVSVSVNQKEIARGKGRSKQLAEQNAAQKAINLI